MTAQQIKDNTDLLIRQKTAQHSILKTEVAQQLDDIVDLVETNIPLTGTTTGNPVTGNIEIEEKTGIEIFSQEDGVGRASIFITQPDEGVKLSHNDFNNSLKA